MAADARDRLTPLDERVEKLLTTIPPEVQRKGMSSNSFADVSEEALEGHMPSQ